MRSSWIQPRLGKDNVTQMNFARNGYITEEMDFVAKKENLPASLIMEEVARGRLIIPANINHPLATSSIINEAGRFSFLATKSISSVTYPFLAKFI